MLLPFDGAPVVRDPASCAALLARPVPKRSLQLFSIHLMGTARMSEDPRRGVTGSFGEFHGVPGLIVADASLFPGPVGINPMETVIALAMRNARRLVERRDGYARLSASSRRPPGCRARRGSPRRSCRVGSLASLE